jgi:hypothetical protein
MAGEMMPSDVEAVRFVKPNGRALYGMLHTVEERRGDVGIIILSPGIKNRVAPHRLYVKMAKLFQKMGYEVFRFDPEGLGDSEGEIDVALAADLYRSIQTGRFIEDTVEAMNWMERERGVSRFILSGLCGGAITGLLAGADDHRVAGLLSLGIPVILDGSAVDSSQFVTEGQLERLKKGYLKKLTDPKSWVRLLTFRSSFGMLFKSFFRKKKPQDPGQPDNYNPLFSKAFESFAAAGKKMLLLFSGADRLYWEFQEKFLERHGALAERYSDLYAVHVTNEANHIYSFEEWQRDMLSVSRAWLTDNFPVSRGG